MSCLSLSEFFSANSKISKTRNTNCCAKTAPLRWSTTLRSVLLFLVMNFFQNARADLPIHAMLCDIYGLWSFHLSKEVTGPDISCGSGLPNTLEGNLELGDYTEYIAKNFGISRVLEAELSLDLVPYKGESENASRVKWQVLAVKSPSDGSLIGRWTAVYDQGFEVVFETGLRLFFYISYSKKSENEYETDPQKTQIGWATAYLGDGKFVRSCASGTKISAARLHGLATVTMKNEHTEAKHRIIDRIIVNGQYVFSPAGEKSSNSKKVGGYACKCDETYYHDFGDIADDLPREFIWKPRKEAPALNQFSCGSCYVIASLYVLREKFLLFMETQGFPIDHDHSVKIFNSTLDVNDATHCEYFNQGCHGGYPYLVGKHALENGLRLSQVTNAKSNGPLAEIATSYECNSPPHDLDTQVRLFARDYGYVGGCYQCTSCQGEKLIMREIYENGPVIVAIDASVLPSDYVDGIIDPIKENIPHTSACDIEGHGHLAGWEYTSHAVVILGWGEQHTHEGVVKFWIARNSWGPEWGQDGNFKIVRGKNAFGIESEAVFIDPDFSRISQAHISREHTISRHSG